jgi:hypothetical protein
MFDIEYQERKRLNLKYIVGNQNNNNNNKISMKTFPG